MIQGVKQPRISIIIASRPGSHPAAVERLKTWDIVPGEVELWVVRGRQPSRQRNMAAREARGDILYFLDDDSLPLPENLARIQKLFLDESLGAVGGPSLCPRDAGPSQTLFATVMSNKLAFGPSVARYSQIGQLRSTNEKELILCNLAIRKALFWEVGGLDESLYPNEENALLDHLIATKKKVIYDPDLVVERYPRKHLKAYLHMVHTYGRGRGEQMLRHPAWGSAMNLAPPLLVVYALLTGFLPMWMKWPWVIYVMIIGGFCAFSPGRHKLLVALLVIATHFAYGIGLWNGLLTPRWRRSTKPDPGEIELEQIALP